MQSKGLSRVFSNMAPHERLPEILVVPREKTPTRGPISRARTVRDFVRTVRLTGPEGDVSTVLSLLNYGLEKTLESPLDCKEIQPVHPEGDQSWVFIGCLPQPGALGP